MIKLVPNSPIQTDDGKWYVEATADSTSDLTSVTMIEGLAVAFGSLCLIGGSGDFYYFDSTTWKKVGS